MRVAVRGSLKETPDMSMLWVQPVAILAFRSGL